VRAQGVGDRQLRKEGGKEGKKRKHQREKAKVNNNICGTGNKGRMRIQEVVKQGKDDRCTFYGKGGRTDMRMDPRKQNKSLKKRRMARKHRARPCTTEK